MSVSFTRLFVHLVWSTRLREPLLSTEFGPRLHECVAVHARRMGCEPIAVGGVEDHVHALVVLAPAVSVSQLARELKAPTAHFAKQTLDLHDFAWQRGYGAISLREAEVEVVRRYVERQPMHHAEGKTSAILERVSAD